MKEGILMYQTIKSINEISKWLLILLSAGLVLRCIKDIMKAQSDDETGFKEALKKCAKRIYATVIAVGVSSLVAYFSNFY